jgi:hypothetical protein
LNECKRAGIRVYVEGLSLDAGRLRGEPSLVPLGQQSIWGLLCLLGDSVDSFRTVLRLLGSSDSGQSTKTGLVSEVAQVMELSRTHAPFAQLNMVGILLGGK